MAARELNAVELDERVLLDLAHSTDPVGVLSIDAYPRVPDPGSRSWTIDRDNRLAELKPRDQSFPWTPRHASRRSPGPPPPDRSPTRTASRLSCVGERVEIHSSPHGGRDGAGGRSRHGCLSIPDSTGHHEPVGRGLIRALPRPRRHRREDLEARRGTDPRGRTRARSGVTGACLRGAGDGRGTSGVRPQQLAPRSADRGCAGAARKARHQLAASRPRQRPSPLPRALRRREGRGRAIALGHAMTAIARQAKA
jgi:hypothetical protein